MNLLLIDHEDSFTYNLAHLLSGFGNLEVKNFYDIKEKSIKKSDIIIFSPGPGKPSDYPVSLDIYNNYKSIQHEVQSLLAISSLVALLWRAVLIFSPALIILVIQFI